MVITPIQAYNSYCGIVWGALVNNPSGRFLLLLAQSFLLFLESHGIIRVVKVIFAKKQIIIIGVRPKYLRNKRKLSRKQLDG